MLIYLFRATFWAPVAFVAIGSIAQVKDHGASYFIPWAYLGDSLVGVPIWACLTLAAVSAVLLTALDGWD